MHFQRRARSPRNGFALVVTLSLMILLTIVAVGLLTLSTISLRTTSQAAAQAEARANARLALMVALGELQKEMGPDMRISSESALLDSNAATEEIEGVSQSHWMGCYNSWGDWLNASYTPPDSTGSLKIADTYTPGREKMFRRWLLSLPAGMETKINAPTTLSGWDNTNSVELIGTGTLGTSAKKENITRAYLTPVGKAGKYAWWIGPENHKAKISLTGQPRTLAAAQWQESQGDTGEVGVGSLAGFEKLDVKSDLGKKLITTNSLRPAEIDKNKVEERFFDLTASSQGVIASVRGSLKKDLSLLFEKSSSQLPAPYKFTPGSDLREPSIRPMSSELAAKNPVRPNRYFASWTNMRHYYRMYRGSSDATSTGGTGGPGILTWARTQPSTKWVSTTTAGSTTQDWDGSNNYWRVPILAKVTFIYSLLAEASATAAGKFDCYQVYTPVFTFWNPYNTEMRVPNSTVSMLTSAYKIMPNAGQFYLGNTISKPTNALGLSINTQTTLTSGGSSEIVFKPGEIRVFSFNSRTAATGSVFVDLVPGFDPQAIGGEKYKWGTFAQNENPGLAVEFSHSYWGGNVNLGNTGGAFAFVWWYNRAGSSGSLPMTYSNDWFQRNPHVPDQTHSPMTPPGLANVARWLFDGQPLPVAFGQLVLKTSSELEYKSINWAQDWRCRNWIQAPPSYFGSGTYISMDDTIAHTQRLDCPYAMYFGPLKSGTDLKDAVGYEPATGRAYLGSGSNPNEKVTAVPILELPSAPISSLAGFSNMRINPGWTNLKTVYPDIEQKGYTGDGYTSNRASLYASEVKAVSYQSGVTGPGIGNSFMHPMLPRTDIYRALDNSKSQDTLNRQSWTVTETVDTKSYNDYWDHVFLLNDVLWDDYFVSSLADQKRPTSAIARTLSQNLDQLVSNKDLSNIRYRFYNAGKSTADVKKDLESATDYLKAAKYLMVDGMFNVNSTSVAAWKALFAGIRERQLVYRDSAGALRNVIVPSDKRIALSRFDTETSDKEMLDPENGATLPDGLKAWTGVRYLDDDQLLRLAQECVKQVKQRGPFLNFSEFVNRRLSADQLGLIGALQSAIDYDDGSPDSNSINYRYKNKSAYMLKKTQLERTTPPLAKHTFSTPEAAEGSRFAGIPGYVIQSDLLKPIGNTLAVRDDTFRIRAYGQANDASGKVTARAYCEAIVQRKPEYSDPKNDSEEPTRLLNTDGKFSDNSALSTLNRRFGRKFHVTDFRWLGQNEI